MNVNGLIFRTSLRTTAIASTVAGPSVSNRRIGILTFASIVVVNVVKDVFSLSFRLGCCFFFCRRRGAQPPRIYVRMTQSCQKRAQSGSSKGLVGENDVFDQDSAVPCKCLRYFLRAFPLFSPHVFDAFPSISSDEKRYTSG